MKKFAYTILIALVTAGAGYLVKYLEEEKNRKFVYARLKKYSGVAEKSAKSYSKKAKKLFDKKMKEIKL